MEKLVQELKDGVLNHLRKGDNLDKPYMATKSKSYTQNELITEIENNTEFGNEVISSLILLSLDLFERGKEDIPGIEKK